MAKGFFDDSDPDLDPMDQETCPPGNYEISGIERWITKDNDIPIYVPFVDGTLVARLAMSRKDNGPGPAWSGNAADLKLLVRSFGGDIKSLPEDELTSEFLVAVEKQIRVSKKTVHVTVNQDGWVSNVKEATPPEGYYRVKLAGAFAKGNPHPLTFQPNQFSSEDGVENEARWKIALKFELCGNALTGKETPFDGYIINRDLYNPFDGHENGMPKMRKNPNGSRPVDVTRLYKLVDAFCPEVWDWQEEDWAIVEDEITRYEHPIHIVVQHAVENGYMAVGHYTPNKRGRLDLDPLSLAPIEREETEEGTIQAETVYDPNGEFVKEHPQLADLVSLIWKQNSKAFKTVPIKTLKELALTPEGIEWANANMVTLMRKAQLEPAAKAINEFTEEEAQALLVAVLSGESEQQGWS